MKIYNHNSILRFGKHSGHSILDIIKEDPEYLNWCQENLDHFFLSEAALRIAKVFNPSFKLSDAATMKRDEFKIHLKESTKEDDVEDWQREQYFEEMNTQAMYDDLDSYSPYTEEQGDISNNINFKIDPEN